MNDKDLEAFEKWELDYFGTGKDENCPHYMIHIKTAWQAACEYKQEEIKDIISFQNTEIIHLNKKIDDQDDEYCKDVAYLDEKIKKLQAENKKLRKALESVGYLHLSSEQVITTAREALEEE